MGDRGTASFPIFYLLSPILSSRPGGPLTCLFLVAAAGVRRLWDFFSLAES